MKFGVMNNPRLDLDGQVRAIGEAGFDFLDLTLEGPQALDLDVSRVQDLLERHGLFAVGHTDPCLPYAYPLASVRAACFEELSRCAAVFSALGARAMNIHPCYACPPGARPLLEDFHRETLPLLVKLAENFGLALMLENFLAPFNTVSGFRRLLEAVPGLALHLDVGHANLGGSTPEEFCRSLGPRIAHVHFSDNRGNADHHMPLGVGNVNWKSVVAALKSAGYDGTVTLEVFCDDPDMLWVYLDASRRFVKKLWEETAL